MLRAIAARGVAIVFVSSETEEVLALSDRVVVMHRGRIAADLDAVAATREAILRAAMGSAPS